MAGRWAQWAVACFVVACGGAAWWMAARMPEGVLFAMVLGGWVMVVGSAFGGSDARGSRMLRVAVSLCAACMGAGVVERYWGEWMSLLPDDPWRWAVLLPDAVRAVDARSGDWRGWTPAAGALLTLVAAGLAALSAWQEVSGEKGPWRRAWEWLAARLEHQGVVAQAFVIGAPVAVGAGASAVAAWVPLGALPWMALGGWGAGLATWYAVPDERSTAGVRMGVYAGSAWLGAGVFAQFWAMWAAGLPVDPWRAALAFPGAVAGVQAQFDGMLALAPWIAGVLTLAGAVVAVQAGWNWVFAKERYDEGRRTSGSELFGKSRLMGRRMMQRMSRDGGIILGAMAKSVKGLVVSYPLEGAKLTFSGPRTGKTSGIAANLLAVDGKGYVDGSTMIIDPRGELFFVTAQRRKALGRNVVLVDPFGEVKKLSELFKAVVRVPSTETVRFNPLDFIRDGNEGVSDVRALLEGLLTPPARQGADNARHFYESAKATMSGVVAYVHWLGRDAEEGAFPLRTVRTFLTASDTNEGLMRKDVERDPTIGWGLPLDAIQRMDKVGQAEGGSNYTTIANQCDWLQVPELDESTQTSTFDPMVMAEGNTDLFIVVPEEKLEAATAWLRMWVVTVNAVASRKLDHGGITIVIDEAPRLGYLKPVMDSFYMASGKGIRYEVYSQSKSAMDAVWQRDNTEIMMDLAEVLQIVDFPRANPEFADRVSKMIGHATYENVSRSEQGTVAGGDVMRREQSVQSGTNLGLVKERLIPPEDLMMLGADEQIVLTNSKVVGREAMKLYRVRYWERADMKHLAAPNPYVLRKEAERKAA